MRVALHSIVKDGHESSYDREHERIPADLAASFARIGIRDWTIWRSGAHLFHVVDCDDFEAAMRALQDDPADAAWQAHIGQHVDHFVLDGPSPQGMMLSQVWRLSEQRG